jgi:maleate isomerase
MSTSSLPRALATITPSGNRVVERVTQAICREAGVDALFTRIPVHGDTGGVADYDWPRMEEAAALLAHARPDAISWNGTKGGAMGFDVDHRLVERMGAVAAAPASTAALGILQALGEFGARTIALVTPYDDAYQRKCIAAFAAKGLPCAAERHAGLTDNFSYCIVPEGDIAAMTRAAVAESRPDAVVFFCTNFEGARVAPQLEAELGLPVLDSTALGVWAALRSMGADTSGLVGWGRVFGLPAR